MTEKIYRILCDITEETVKGKLENPYRVIPSDYEDEITEFFKFLYKKFKKES